MISIRRVMSRDGFTGADVWLALGADGLADRTKAPARLRPHILDSHKTYYGIFYIALKTKGQIICGWPGSIKVYLSKAEPCDQNPAQQA